MSKVSMVLLVVGIVLSVVMGVVLDATFAEWVAGFASIITLLVGIKGGQAVHKKVKSKGNQKVS